MSDSAAPSSTKPYLIRAIHEWCSDNGLTPYIAVSVNEHVRVPREHVRNGEIVLNVGMLATDKLQITNRDITFHARFSGRVHDIMVPIDNVVAIYAKETGNGMAFEVSKAPAEGQETRLAAVDAAAPAMPEQPAAEPVSGKAPQGEDEPPSPTKPSTGRPKLTRVK
ncbi:MAG: hypothetical protein RL676_269 [Pseudomonadota bacterium]|jgi:stringent starvation protein B